MCKTNKNKQTNKKLRSQMDLIDMDISDMLCLTPGMEKCNQGISILVNLVIWMKIWSESC